jgi:hypothetical protein
MTEFKLAWWHLRRGFKELFHIGLIGYCSLCGAAIFDTDSYSIGGGYGLHCLRHYPYNT